MARSGSLLEDRTMTPLRQRMIAAMDMRGFSPRTHESYLDAVRDLAKFTRRSPDTLEHSDLARYFEHLVRERQLAPASVRLYYCGIRFLYLQVLAWPAVELEVALPKRPQRIPELLTRAEVASVLNACADPRYRAMLAVAYGCGLRLSEILALRVKDLDGERKLLRVEQGKGAQDRLVPLSPTLLEELRAYWRLYRPQERLFAGRGGEPLCATGLQRAYTLAKRAAGVTKDGGIHSLRHAYATHQLAAGLPVERLQRLMGHRRIQTTLRYFHWLPSDGEGEGARDLLANLGADHG
jgi:integrase/recombinase XerD